MHKRRLLAENRVGRILKNREEHLHSTQIEIPRWTAEEFERLVFAGEPKVAVFDCDGTLWKGDSAVGFMNWTIEQGLISRSTSDWMDARYREYLAGAVSELAICGEMVQIYAGLREKELNEAAAKYMSEFLPGAVFEEMAALVAALEKAGVELWAVSSTCKWVIAEGARVFGIPEERVLAVELGVVKGLITTELLDVPTDEGKAESLTRRGVTRPDAVFGNSIHDLQMLEMGGAAYPVNPTAELMEAMAGRGWGYFMPQGAEG